MNVSAVRQALADRLATIEAVQVNPYALSQPTPPGFQILPPGRTYDFAMGGANGLSEWTFVVQAFVNFGSDVGAQVLLDEMITDGATSVKALLEADKTLGGLVQTLRVLESSPGRMVELPSGNPMLLVEWRVQILS